MFSGMSVGKYRGRPEDVHRNAGIGAMLRGGASWSAIQKGDARCSHAAIRFKMRPPERTRQRVVYVSHTPREAASRTSRNKRSWVGV